MVNDHNHCHFNWLHFKSFELFWLLLSELAWLLSDLVAANSTNSLKKRTGCIALLFEQNISIEITKLQITCLPVFSAHQRFFCNVESMCAHMVACLKRLNKPLGRKCIDLREKYWLGNWTSWHLATATMNICGSLLPVHDDTNDKFKCNNFRINNWVISADNYT